MQTGHSHVSAKGTLGTRILAIAHTLKCLRMHLREHIEGMVQLQLWKDKGGKIDTAGSSHTYHTCTFDEHWRVSRTRRGSKRFARATQASTFHVKSQELASPIMSTFTWWGTRLFSNPVDQREAVKVKLAFKLLDFCHWVSNTHVCPHEHSSASVCTQSARYGYSWVPELIR